MRQLTVLLLLVLCSMSAAQVSTETEINNTARNGEAKFGYYNIAKPFEVSMTVNLWGEVFQQGLYVVGTSTDIIQLISYSGGQKESANLDEVLLYRKGAKDAKTRIIKRINVKQILEGKFESVQLVPGDMVVVQKKPAPFDWQMTLSIVNTVASLTVLGITIYNLTK